jgi:hypothetical protein
MDRFQEWAKLVSDDLDVDLELWRHQFPWEVSTADPIVASLAESLRVVTGAEPDFYPLPFSSSSGFFKNVPKISPVAFSGGDIAQIGPREHAVISRNVLAAGAIAGAIINFENLG